jgi:hypothetical protein
MTPQERELVSDLFDRLAALESQPRDAEAERLIDDGLRRAPHAVYALVQSVLVQDEALRQADSRIVELEDALDERTDRPREPRGFLDNMRDALFGQGEESRGSVPPVRPGERPMGVPQQYRGQAISESTPAPPHTSRGMSFLGTAAAAAAGVIGGGLLLDGIRSALGGDRQGAFAGTFDQIKGEPSSTWGAGEDSGSLARQAGLGDIGQTRNTSLDEDQDRGAGLFDASADDEDFNFEEDGGEFDIGGEDV